MTSESFNMTSESFNLKIGRPRKRVELKKVAEMIREGKTLQEMAEIFNVSYGTVWSRCKEAREEMRRI